jgi:uncharacterized membrane protein SirB2
MSTPFSQAIQTHSWAIPSIQVVHIISLATLFAIALNLALRVMGRGLTDEPASAAVQRIVPLMRLLLVVLLVSGVLLIIAEPFRTITNVTFYLKMGMLLVAIVLTAWLVALAKREPECPASGALKTVVAVCSMLVWAGIMIAGRFIAYTAV